MAELSGSQRRALLALAKDGAKISTRRGIGGCTISGAASMTHATFWALLKRGYVAEVGKTNFGEVYEISPAGRQALAQALVRVTPEVTNT